MSHLQGTKCTQRKYNCMERHPSSSESVNLDTSNIPTTLAPVMSASESDNSDASYARSKRRKVTHTTIKASQKCPELPADSFRHDPLDLKAHSFRLLRLCKSTLGIIRCELFNAFFDGESVIEYDALSYTWDGNHKAHEIEVNGSRMGVTKNLLLALENLQKSDEDRILWIDAICIDQDNDKERGHQVRQMGSIYTNAKQVIIWLGPATLSTDSVFDAMSRFEEETIGYTDKDWEILDEQRRKILGFEFSAMPQQRIGFSDLVARPWFDRVWIIQEVANARAARVACGAKSVLARTFTRFINYHGVKPNQHRQAILDLMLGHIQNNSRWTRKYDLHTLLLKFKGSKASDQRDKIYALLGISSDRSTMGFPVPDYEKSEVEVVQDTVAFLLQLPLRTNGTSYASALTLDEFMHHLEDLEYMADRTCFWAAENGSAAIVECLLNAWKVNLDLENRQYQTSLLRAAENGHTAVVRLLVEVGKANVDVRDLMGRTPLLLATEHRYQEMIKLLLESGKADVNAQDKKGQTPLMTATKSGNQNIVELIIGSNAVDTELGDVNGWKPLWRAAIEGHEAIVNMLLQTKAADVLKPAHGVSVETEKRVALELLKIHMNGHDLEHDDKQQAPLAFAVKCDNMKLFGLLLEVTTVDLGRLYILRPKVVNGTVHKNKRLLLVEWAAMNKQPTVVKMLLDTLTVDLTEHANWARELVLWAVNNEEPTLIGLLLNTGHADVIFKSQAGRDAVKTAISKGDTVMVDLLLQSGMGDYLGKEQLLSIAVGKGSPDMFRHILNTWVIDANLRIPGWALDVALKDQNIPNVKLLLEMPNFDMDSMYPKKTDGWTPLHREVGYGLVSVVKLLLDSKRFDVDARDRSGETPLSIAVGQGHTEVVKLLLDTKSVDVNNKRRGDGTTPLSKAARLGYVGIVKLLLETNDAGVRTRDDSGLTPLDYAKRNGNTETVELLEKYGTS